MKSPASKRLLDDAIQRLAGTKTYDLRYTGLRAIIADVVIGQMLPDCVVKGGSSLKLRYGTEHTRFTLDFDTASKLDTESFIKATATANCSKNGACESQGIWRVNRSA